MRIGFDVSPLHGAYPPGVARATRGLVEALEERGVVEVVRLAPPGSAQPSGPEWNAAGRNAAGKSGDERAWRRKLGRSVRELGLVGIHSPISAFAWRGPGRRVQTIHELPWRHGVAENADLAHRLWARIGSRRADRVVCPTEFVARDLCGRSLRPNVVVCPWGVGAPFADEPPPGVVDEVVLGRYRLGEDPFALCVGAVRPKKNLAALLHGVAELVRRGSRRLALVVTGKETQSLRRDLGLASQLGLARWVSTPGFVAEEDLPSLMRLATVVPVLSFSEGFGLPVLEALASGTPALVARDSAALEVAGSAGIVVDPDDPNSVADGLERALIAREELRWPSVDRAAEFTWSRTAACVEALWKELA